MFSDAVAIAVVSWSANIGRPLEGPRRQSDSVLRNGSQVDSYFRFWSFGIVSFQTTSQINQTSVPPSIGVFAFSARRDAISDYGNCEGRRDLRRFVKDPRRRPDKCRGSQIESTPIKRPRITRSPFPIIISAAVISVRARSNGLLRASTLLLSRTCAVGTHGFIICRPMTGTGRPSRA